MTAYLDADGHGARPVIPIANNGGIPTFKFADSAGTSPTLRQTTKANSLPVVLPSDQFPALGQATMANSLPVTIASDQPIFVAALIGLR